MTKNVALNKQTVIYFSVAGIMIALAIFALGSLFNCSVAFAETDNIDAEISEYQQIIEDSSKKYDEAISKSSELKSQIEDNEQKLGELNDALPKQQERANAAVRELYSLDKVMGQLINWILGIEDVTTAITNLDYIEYVRDKNLSRIEESKRTKSELESTKSNLESQKAEVDKLADEAATSLAEAQAARQEAQQRAAEQAERERAAAEAAVKAAEEQAKNSSDNSDSGSSNSNDTVSPPDGDGADWSSDKETFVNSWAGRIDNYLSGSPLAGQGKTFASAAWDYGVDPRWSPAISYTESSKGLYCFKSHNAWGWGSLSWGSWEEAIDAHVRGLARGYGYTISIEAAKKYCPPNWEHWYSVTSAQMNMI